MLLRNFVISNFVPAPMQNMRNKSVFALGYLIASCSFQKGKSLQVISELHAKPIMLCITTREF